MKQLALLLIITFLLAACKTRKPVSDAAGFGETVATEVRTDFSKQETWLLGYFSSSQFHSAPHSEWFMMGYDTYMPDETAVKKLTETEKSQLTIKVVMGSWCPDSRREVPRFMRLMDLINFPSGKIVFIGVDNTKLSPVGEYGSLGIERVPTFILYKNNIEAGRIIETPLTSLEQDMVNILEKE